MNTVLVVDDKEMMRDSVGATLTRAGFAVVTAPDAAAALEAVARKRPDALVTDLKMPGMTGLDLLAKVREIDDDLPVVLMTAFGTIETAVAAMKAGAFDYVTKPFEGDELIIAVKRAIQHARLVRENALLRSAAAPGTPADADAAPAPRGLERIIGDSPAIRRVKEQVHALAESQGTVLICGESGAGKEVIARAIHDLSPRAAEPFLAVNCAALSESLLESELFGHEKGAFTGADRTRKGRFELADRGTLLLDEVSEISPPLQAKLLRVLQERTFERVGSSLTIGVDVRVIATSNRDLPQSVARGEFRQDLFFRLNVLPVHLPPLRDRLEDVPSMAEHFVRVIARREGRTPVRFEPDALALMQQYHWPGNVRELQNVCERAVVLTAKPRHKADATEPSIPRTLIEPWLGQWAHLTRPTPPAFTPAQPPAPFAPAMNTLSPANLPGQMPVRIPLAPPVGATTAPAFAHAVEPKIPGMNGALAVEGHTLEEIEREAIVHMLKKFNGHRQKTARSLGIGVRTLGLKLKKWKEMKLVHESL